MFFDPLSTWLVALIVDGVAVVSERSRGPSAKEIDEKRKEQAEQENKNLNKCIRITKEKYGLESPVMAYEEIQRRISLA